MNIILNNFLTKKIYYKLIRAMKILSWYHKQLLTRSFKKNTVILFERKIDCTKYEKNM